MEVVDDSLSVGGRAKDVRVNARDDVRVLHVALDVVGHQVFVDGDATEGSGLAVVLHLHVDVVVIDVNHQRLHNLRIRYAHVALDRVVVVAHRTHERRQEGRFVRRYRRRFLDGPDDVRVSRDGDGACSGRHSLAHQTLVVAHSGIVELVAQGIAVATVDTYDQVVLAHLERRNLGGCHRAGVQVFHAVEFERLSIATREAAAATDVQVALRKSNGEATAVTERASHR